LTIHPRGPLAPPLVGAMVLALAILMAWAGPGGGEARPRILTVFDEDKDFPGLAVINRSLRETFRTELADGVEFYSESLNLSQFGHPGHDEALRDHFQRKYAGTRPDLIVAVMGPSLDFLLRHGEALFPGVPIVFCGVDAAEMTGLTLRQNVTGTLVRRAYAPTLDIALRLQPDTRHVFVVGGVSAFDRQLQALARRDLAPFGSRVTISYLTTLSMRDLLGRMAALPPHSVVLYLTMLADGAGRAFIPHEALGLITAAANAPVYVSVDQYLGRGAVGGHVYSLDAHGRHAARLGLRILRGEQPADIAPVEPPSHSNVFDWRQLQRWGLDEARLPPDSVVNYRTLSAWAMYRWYIVGGVSLLVLQSTLLLRLLVSRAQRRRAQRTLAERLQFETVLSEVSASFVTLPARAVDERIEATLQRVAEALDFDRAALVEADEHRNSLRVTHAWARAGVRQLAPVAPGRDALPWVASRMDQGHVVEAPGLDALPPEAAGDRRTLVERGVVSLAAAPLMVAGTTVGALGFSRLHHERAWPVELTARLRLLADIFANVLARRRADSAVRQSEERRRHAEEEAQRQRDELAHALRVATLGEMTASFAHEINQPLAAIITNAAATRRLLAGAWAKPGDVDAALNDISEDARRASQTIRRLRTLFLKEHGERTVVDVNALIDEMLALLRGNLQAKSVSVSFKPLDALLVVLGDPIQLRQVVLNVIVNAAEAIALTTDGGPREIQIDTGQPAPGRVAIAIRDSGVGAEEAALERMFEHFVSTKPQGLGMGLAISRSIVEAHGGRIWARRNEDRGLTFHIELPYDGTRG
jgi:signal transduction histidine kinase